MKKAIFILVAIAAIALMGCPSLNMPLLLGDGTIGPRTGQASGQIILGIFGNADAGMITAAKNAGITQIGAVDFQVKQFIGPIVMTFTTTVTGQ